MPEQLSKHPEVTITVLRSAGARCAEGAPQDILKACPTERFCKLPGGEVCVYGLPEATSMTQISRAEWQGVLGAPAYGGQQLPPVAGASLAIGLVLGGVGGWWLARRR